MSRGNQIREFINFTQHMSRSWTVLSHHHLHTATQLGVKRHKCRSTLTTTVTTTATTATNTLHHCDHQHCRHCHHVNHHVTIGTTVSWRWSTERLYWGVVSCTFQQGRKLFKKIILTPARCNSRRLFCWTVWVWVGSLYDKKSRVSPSTRTADWNLRSVWELEFRFFFWWRGFTVDVGLSQRSPLQGCCQLLLCDKEWVRGSPFDL